MSEETVSTALPVELSELPKAVQRFCNPKGPTPARLMAARGLVPVAGNDQITMLAQLSADVDDDVKQTALDSLKGLPPGVLRTACDAALHPAVLDLLARHLTEEDAIGALVANRATADITVERIARRAGELLCERIAVNEERLLNSPSIIEALYKNKSMRMSTADRLVELASRNGVELTGIPAFKAHAEALQGQLIPEPSDEPLPGDMAFAESLADADAEADAEAEAEVDAEAEAEAKRKQKAKPLNMQIAEMSKHEKLRLAVIGSMSARGLLVRDNDKQIAYAAISSPQVTAAEAAEVAKSKEISEEVLRYIGNKRDWMKAGEVKRALIFNPKTPVGISLKFLGHMRINELEKLSRNKNVSGQLRATAAQWVIRRNKR